MELEELDTNLVEIEEFKYFKCRTCLYTSDKTMCFTQINQLCSPDKSVKDILIQMIPQMETTVSEEDRVCRSCLKTILAYVRFVDKCLDIEAQLNQENEELAKQLEEDETMETVQIPDPSDLDNAQIVENIEIVVENDLQNHFKSAKVSGEGKQRNPSDHVYIKTEYEETTEDDEGIMPLEITEDGGSIDETGELSADAVYEEYDDAFSNHEIITEDGELVEAEDGEIIEGVNEYLETDLENVQIKQEIEGEDSNNLIEVYMDPECVICEVCGKFIRDQESLKRHLQTHNSTIYKCSECPKAFRARHLLRNHINTVHDPDTTGIRLQCSKCPKLFKNKPALAAHYKLKHDEETSFTCQICSEVFARADYLRKHLQTHTGENPKKNRTSTTPGKFLRFKNTDDPLPCKICGKFYNGINKLKVHLQTHVVVKRYQCEYCNLTYKRWPSLKRHEKTHTESDENFHRCNVCWKRLKTEDELKLHMASHGNPKYQCHICDEQFHRKYLFDNHYLLEHATPEDLENSKKEIIYDTLLELSAKLG